MKAKELYRELESGLKAWLATRDFKKRRTSRLMFQRVLPRAIEEMQSWSLPTYRR